MNASSNVPPRGLSLAQAFNRNCRCTIVDEPALAQGLKAALRIEDTSASVPDSAASMFSATAVFLSRQDVDQLRSTIEAIEQVIAMPDYQARALSWADPIARITHGTHGVCMGYDFHLDETGPKLIEINTNAGGLMLNAVLSRAARACCSEVERMAVGCADPMKLDEIIVNMFIAEWRSQRVALNLKSIAIVDDHPDSQYLSLEFELFAELFRGHGLQAVIAEASTLTLRDSVLLSGDRPIDLVYNRLTDFALAMPQHESLREAYGSGAAVVSPNPRIYALYADKRNLSLLTDPKFLESLQLSANTVDRLTHGVPQTLLVTPELSTRFWDERRRWFFKPVMGFGSRGAYRGDKKTKRVFEEIVRGGYIAQARIEPAKRANPKKEAEPLKYDVRCYVYRGEIQLIAARLYQGQTTNFRTPGGGFAPVFYATATP